MKTRDDIEKLIQQHLESLNSAEPQEGHFERFEHKLNRQNKKKKVNYNMVWKVAAIVIIVLLAANQAYIYLSPDAQKSMMERNPKNEISLASVSDEYREVEFYYTNAINVGLREWGELEQAGLITSAEQNLMDNELEEFEARFKTLQADLAANPNDERVINAMLEYYQAKLSIISLIVSKLEEVKTQKNNYHETDI